MDGQGRVLQNSPQSEDDPLPHHVKRCRRETSTPPLLMNITQEVLQRVAHEYGVRARQSTEALSKHGFGSCLVNLTQTRFMTATLSTVWLSKYS